MEIARQQHSLCEWIESDRSGFFLLCCHRGNYICFHLEHVKMIMNCSCTRRCRRCFHWWNVPWMKSIRDIDESYDFISYIVVSIEIGVFDAFHTMTELYWNLPSTHLQARKISIRLVENVINTNLIIKRCVCCFQRGTTYLSFQFFIVSKIFRYC